MKILSIILLAMSAFADSGGTFEVKELAPEIVTKISASDSKLDAATTALAEAQKVMESAQSEHEALMTLAKASVGVPFEGACSYSQVNSLSPIMASRLFQRIEIRGKYALITTGTEPCGLGFGSSVLTNDLVFRQ